MPNARSPGPSPIFPWITVGLCMVMLLLHATLGPSGADPASGTQRLALLDAGAKSASLVSDLSQGWRVLTAHVVHTGWIHLLFNLAFFFPVAAALECVLVRVDYALCLLAIALCSGLASLVWTPEISAGASGLVYGVLGSSVLVGLRFAPALRGRMRLHFGLWVLPFLLLILFFGANNPNLDHHNHLGGLVSGLVMVPLLRLNPRYMRGVDPKRLRAQSARRGLALLSLLALTLLLVPHLVRTLAPARVLTCMGVEAQLPAKWGGPIPAKSCQVSGKTLGAAHVSVPNDSTLVSLEFTRIPFAPQRGLQWRHAWEEYRASLQDPRAPQDSVRSWSKDCEEPQARTHPYRCTQTLSFVREGVAMQAEVQWLRRPGHWLALRLETPIRWWARYAPVRESVLNSVQPRGSQTRNAGGGSVLRAAIP